MNFVGALEIFSAELQLSLTADTVLNNSIFPLQGSGWRPEISESVRQLLMEEISASNPPFPVQSFISRFLKRRTDHQQHCTASGQSNEQLLHLNTETKVDKLQFILRL